MIGKEARNSDVQMAPPSADQGDIAPNYTPIGQGKPALQVAVTSLSKCLSDVSPIPQEPQPGCCNWGDMEDTVTQDELSEDVKKDVQQRGALYAKHLSCMTLVHEMQGRAPTGMKYNITLIEK